MMKERVFHAGRQHLGQSDLDCLLNGLPLPADRDAVGDDDDFIECGAVLRMQHILEKVSDHLGVEALHRLKGRSGLSFLDNKGIETHSRQMTANDAEHTVPDCLPVLR